MKAEEYQVLEEQEKTKHRLNLSYLKRGTLPEKKYRGNYVDGTLISRSPTRRRVTSREKRQFPEQMSQVATAELFHQVPRSSTVLRSFARISLVMISFKAKRVLESFLPEALNGIYNFHKALLRHGQRICVFERPRCNKCVLTDLCDYYNTVVKPQ